MSRNRTSERDMLVGVRWAIAIMCIAFIMILGCIKGCEPIHQQPLQQYQEYSMRDPGTSQYGYSKMKP